MITHMQRLAPCHNPAPSQPPSQPLSQPKNACKSSVSQPSQPTAHAPTHDAHPCVGVQAPAHPSVCVHTREVVTVVTVVTLLFLKGIFMAQPVTTVTTSPERGVSPPDSATEERLKLEFRLLNWGRWARSDGPTRGTCASAERYYLPLRSDTEAFASTPMGIDIDDAERLERALLRLPATQRDVLRRIYAQRQPLVMAFRDAMGVRRASEAQRRYGHMLQALRGHLQASACTAKVSRV